MPSSASLRKAIGVVQDNDVTHEDGVVVGFRERAARLPGERAREADSYRRSTALWQVDVGARYSHVQSLGPSSS